MTNDELSRVVLEELRRLAPEIDPAAVSARTHLRDDLDLDSFDFARLVTALHARLGVDVPEPDYRRLETFGGCVDYLAAKQAAPS